MRKDSAPSAPSAGSTKYPIEERLEEYAQAHYQMPYLIGTEAQASELLYALGTVVMSRTDAIAPPMPLQGNEYDEHRDRHNKMTRREVGGVGRAFIRAVANGMALLYCQEHFDEGLVFRGVHIKFPEVH